MKQKITLLFIILTILTLNACQATPEKPVVINKGDNKLQETVQSTPAPTQYITSETQWIETYNITNLECDINAQIILPNTNTFPVFKIEKRKLDTTTVKKIIKHFTAGATGVRETSPTKEELEAKLIYTKKGEYVTDDNGSRWEPYDGQKEDISNLEELIRNAKPEIFDSIPNDLVTLPVNNTYALSGGSRAYIEASDNSFSFCTDKNGLIQLESWIVDGEARPGEPAGTTLNNVKISEEEARIKVISLISELDIKNLGIAEAERARILNYYTAETTTEGWFITLTRNDGDSIPVYLDSSKISGMLFFGADDFIERWWPETITVFVDEKGIQSFYWINLLEAAEEINSNVSLLPLEDIKERIRKNIEYGYLQRVQKGQLSGNHIINVNKIVLTNVLVPVKDDVKYQMSLPAWLIYYKSPSHKGMNFIFAVNAVDGSSIDLAMRKKKSD